MLISSYNKILLFELEFCKTYIKNKENRKTIVYIHKCLRICLFLYDDFCKIEIKIFPKIIISL